MPSRVRLVVSGRVQGVGFRWFVLRRAQGLALAGWVRNREDGAVEIEAQGSDSALAALEAAVAVGPPTSRVDSVDKQDIPHETDGSKMFEII